MYVGDDRSCGDVGDDVDHFYILMIAFLKIAKRTVLQPKVFF